MIRPRRGSVRALGLRFRYAVHPFTLADCEDWMQGGRFRRAAAKRRIEASFLCRVFGFRSIGRDIARQFLDSGLPEHVRQRKGGRPAPRHRDAAAVFAATGLTPQEQAARLTPREWLALVAHLAHDDARRVSLAVATAGGKAKEPPYPDIERGGPAGSAVPSGSPAGDDVVNAWTGGTVGTA